MSQLPEKFELFSHYQLIKTGIRYLSELIVYFILKESLKMLETKETQILGDDPLFDLYGEGNLYVPNHLGFSGSQT